MLDRPHLPTPRYSNTWGKSSLLLDNPYLEFHPVGLEGKFYDHQRHETHHAILGGDTYGVNSEYHWGCWRKYKKLFSNKVTTSLALEILERITDETMADFLAQFFENPQVPTSVKENVAVTVFGEGSKYLLVIPLFGNINSPFTPSPSRLPQWSDSQKRILSYVLQKINLAVLDNFSLTSPATHGNEEQQKYVVATMLKNPTIVKNFTQVYLTWNYSMTKHAFDILPPSEATKSLLIRNAPFFLNASAFQYGNFLNRDTRFSNEEASNMTKQFFIEKLKECEPETYSHLPDSWIEKMFNPLGQK